MRRTVSRSDHTALRDAPDHKNSLEVFDQQGKLLLVMPKASVLRQELRCRAAVLALMDRETRVLLVKLPRTHPRFPGLWDIAVAAYVRPGEAPLDTVLREARVRLNYHAPEPVQTALLPPSALTRNAEVSIFKSTCAFFPSFHGEHVGEPAGEQDAAIPDDSLFVDADELAAFIRDMAELTTPVLRLVAPYIFPVNTTT